MMFAGLAVRVAIMEFTFRQHDRGRSGTSTSTGRMRSSASGSQALVRLAALDATTRKAVLEPPLASSIHDVAKLCAARRAGHGSWS